MKLKEKNFNFTLIMKWLHLNNITEELEKRNLIEIKKLSIAVKNLEKLVLQLKN